MYIFFPVHAIILNAQKCMNPRPAFRVRAYGFSEAAVSTLLSVASEGGDDAPLRPHRRRLRPRVSEHRGGQSDRGGPAARAGGAGGARGAGQHGQREAQWTGASPHRHDPGSIRARSGHDLGTIRARSGHDPGTIRLSDVTLTRKLGEHLTESRIHCRMNRILILFNLFLIKFAFMLFNSDRIRMLSGFIYGTLKCKPTMAACSIWLLILKLRRHRLAVILANVH